MILRSLILIAFGTIALTNGKALGQDHNSWKHTIGINILQLPATTLDLTYEMNNNQKYSVIISSGYTVNYSKSFDWIGFFLSPHSKCGNYGYSLQKQAGGFAKVGLKYNFRKTLEKTNNFFVGTFITNSFIYEKAEYQNWDIPNSQVEVLNHYIYIFGIAGAIGYNFKITTKFNSDFGVQISVPSRKIGRAHV